MRRVALAALLAVGALAAPAHASDDPAQLADAVARDVVHVDPRASDQLSAAQAGRLRLRIARRDLGRIRILVVPPVTAERNGGLQRLANDVAVRTGLDGALLVVAGTDIWITTTYEPGPALMAVRRAMESAKTVPAGLLRAVDGVARVDPGPAADAAPPPGVPPAGVPDDGGVGEVVEDVGEAIRIVVFGIGGIVLLVFLIPLGVVAVRAWRRRAESAEDLEVAQAAAREELVGVGEVLRDLDLDAEMPGADPEGRAALGRAIDLYDRAGRELQRASSGRRLQRARSTIARARAEAELARRRLTGVTAPH